MNKNNLIKQLKFSNELIDKFKLYIDELENYFINNENKEKNMDLYELYCSLKKEVINLSNKYGVLKK